MFVRIKSLILIHSIGDKIEDLEAKLFDIQSYSFKLTSERDEWKRKYEALIENENLEEPNAKIANELKEKCKFL